METLQLEIFNSIASTNSYTKTAELFGISQPAVTQNIQRLENALGIKLVVRSNRGIILTDAGKEFLPYVESILETFDTAQTRMQNLARGQHGHIRIASVPSISKYVSESLYKFKENYASVQIDVDVFEGEEFIKLLMRNEYDFYFVPVDQVDSSSIFEYIRIGTDHLSLFVSTDMAEAVKKDIDTNGWSCLEKYSFISVDMANKQLQIPTKRFFEACKINPRIVNYYNNAISVMLSVGSGLGMAVLPHELVSLCPRDDVTELRCPLSSNEIVYTFAWKKDSLVGVKELFRDTVIELYKENN